MNSSPVRMFIPIMESNKSIIRPFGLNYRTVWMLSIESLHKLSFLMAVDDGQVLGLNFTGYRWRCDYTYVRNANAYFKFHVIPANWRDARLRCQLEGAVLASPYPQVVQDALKQMMTDPDKKRTIFTGIHATFSKGDYYTIDGTPLTKITMNWMESEPDNKNNAESCITLTPQGLAADAKCGDTYPYFCYKQKNDDDIFMVPCGTTDRAYEYSEDTHSCYKYHTVPRTWSRAYMACSAEGGHLAIINSHQEAEVIKRLFNKHPANTILKTASYKDAFIGFHDWDEHGDWRTIHGETINEAGYDVWLNGQPDNLTTGEYCGAVYRQGITLYDVWCENYIPFICEKKPNSLLCDDEEY